MKYLKLFEDIVKKRIIGQGKDFNVYPTKNPNLIVKYKKDGYIQNKYIQTMLNYPDIFPKIIKYTNKYIIVEKLKTEGIEYETNIVMSKIREVGIKTDNNDITRIISYCLRWDEPEKINNIKEKLVNTDEIIIFDKYYNFIKKVFDEMDLYTKDNYTIDWYRFNFGYDKNGNLKLLDV